MTTTGDLPLTVVPRDLYESLLEQHKDLQTRYTALVNQSFDLMGKALEMKRGGLDYTPIPDFEVEDPTPIPLMIQQAILQRVAPHTLEAQTMKERAFAMLRDGANEDEVRDLILQGEDIGL